MWTLEPSGVCPSSSVWDGWTSQFSSIRQLPSEIPFTPSPPVGRASPPPPPPPPALLDPPPQPATANARATRGNAKIVVRDVGDIGVRPPFRGRTRGENAADGTVARTERLRNANEGGSIRKSNERREVMTR